MVTVGELNILIELPKIILIYESNTDRAKKYIGICTNKRTQAILYDRIFTFIVFTNQTPCAASVWPYQVTHMVIFPIIYKWLSLIFLINK